MLVSFINFSRAFKIISIDSHGPKRNIEKRMHPGERVNFFYFFFIAYTQFNKLDEINFIQTLIYRPALEGQKCYKHTVY